jgi:hypothetical protein
MNSSLKYINLEMSFSNKDWKKLVIVQNKLKDKEEETIIKILYFYK